MDNEQALARMYNALKYPVTAAPDWMAKCFEMARSGFYLSKLPPGTRINKTKEGSLYVVELPSDDGFKARALDKRFAIAALKVLQDLRILPRK